MHPQNFIGKIYLAVIREQDTNERLCLTLGSDNGKLYLPSAAAEVEEEVVTTVVNYMYFKYVTRPTKINHVSSTYTMLYCH